MSGYNYFQRTKISSIIKIAFTTLIVLFLSVSSSQKEGSNNKFQKRNLQYASNKKQAIETTGMIFLGLFGTFYIFSISQLLLSCCKEIDEQKESIIKTFLYFTNSSYTIIFTVILFISFGFYEGSIILLVAMFSGIIFLITTIIILCKFCFKCPTDLLESRFAKYLFIIPFIIAKHFFSCAFDPDIICFNNIIMTIVIFFAFVVPAVVCTFAHIILYYCSILIFMILWLPIFWCCGVRQKDNKYSEERYTLFVYRSEVTLNIADENDGSNIIVSKKTTRVIVTKETEK